MKKGDVRAQRHSKMRAVFESEFKELSLYTWQQMYKLSGQYLGKDEIKEILSKTYITAYGSIATKDQEIKNYSGWIRRLIFFDLLTYLKSNIKDKRMLLGLEEMEYSNKLFEFFHYKLETELERQDYLIQLLQLISEEEREVIQLHIEGYTSQEIGKKLKMEAPAVRQRYSRALKKLKRKFKL